MPYVSKIQRTKPQILKAKNYKIDSKHNQVVYELYGLTEEEIGIVEGG
jgi:hypothetical protein